MLRESYYLPRSLMLYFETTSRIISRSCFSREKIGSACLKGDVADPGSDSLIASYSKKRERGVVTSGAGSELEWSCSELLLL